MQIYMAKEDEFHLCLGQIIKFCQCIEHDIKLIYAGMAKGDLVENYKMIQKETLGSAVCLLQDLDRLRSSPFFSNRDYYMLRNITKIRNYWAHQGYVDYLYEPPKSVNLKFSEQLQKLQEDKERLKLLHEATQKIRLQFFSK